MNNAKLCIFKADHPNYEDAVKCKANHEISIEIPTDKNNVGLFLVNIRDIINLVADTYGDNDIFYGVVINDEFFELEKFIERYIH